MSESKFLNILFSLIDIYLILRHSIEWYDGKICGGHETAMAAHLRVRWIGEYGNHI
jgi:hypothetical protein